MKVAFFTSGFPPAEVAGVELYSRALVSELRSLDVECVVLAGTRTPAATTAISMSMEDGLPVSRLLCRGRRLTHRALEWDPAVEPLILEFLAQNRPDLVHVQHWLWVSPRLVALSAQRGVPAVVTLSDQYAVCPRFHRRRANLVPCAAPYTERLCLPCVDRDGWQAEDEIARALRLRYTWIHRELALAARLIAPSPSAADLFSQLSGLPRERLDVLPMPWLHELPLAAREKPGTNGRLRVGHWGHLVPAKGTHLLLLAARTLAPEVPLELHLWGPATPSYAEYLRSLAEGLSVHFHGEYTPADLQEASIDVAAFPSLSAETHSFVVDEARALGLPVIVPDRGAPAERLGSQGLTFRSGSTLDLGRVLRQVARTRQVEASAAQASFPTMAEHARRLHDLYRSIPRPKEAVAMPKDEAEQGLALLHAQVEERDRQIERLLGRDAELSESNARLHQSYRELEGQLQKALEAHLRLEAQYRDLESGYRTLEAHAKTIGSTLDEILASTSWKVLRLLQRLRGGFKR